MDRLQKQVGRDVRGEGVRQTQVRRQLGTVQARAEDPNRHVGAFAGEYMVRRRAGEAGRIGLATWLGLLLAAVANIALIFVMIGVFGFAVAF